MSAIVLGKAVPDFTALATSGNTIQLAALKGQTVVLYFYPRDDTPGCTVEAQDFRQLMPQFIQHHAIVLGISRDSLKSHEKFKCKYELPFELISDHEEALCQLFNVMKDKNMYGKKVRGIERSTFIIDKNGILAAEWRGVKVPEHAATVLEKVKELYL